jgi:hypothetical protein
MATPDWIASTEYIVGANHPDGLPDTKNRAGQTINTMMLVGHDANGRHLLQDYTLRGEINTYTGDGADTQTITFSNSNLKPLLLTVWADNTQTPVEKTDTIPDVDDAFRRPFTSFLGSIFTDFSTGQFIVDSATWNTNLTVYYYRVIGIDTTSTYTGDAGAGSDPTWITSSTLNRMIADDSASISSDNIGNNVESFIWTEFIEEHDADGAHTTDPYAGFGRIESGTYTGNSTDDRDISLTYSIDIKYLLVISDTATAATRNESMSGDNTKREATAAFQANFIQSLGTGTFQVGNAAAINLTDTPFYYIAIGA